MGHRVYIAVAQQLSLPESFISLLFFHCCWKSHSHICIVPAFTTLQISLYRKNKGTWKNHPDNAQVFLRCFSIIYPHCFKFYHPWYALIWSVFKSQSLAWLYQMEAFQWKERGEKYTSFYCLGFCKSLLQKAVAVLSLWHCSFQTANIRIIWPSICCILACYLLTFSSL